MDNFLILFSCSQSIHHNVPTWGKGLGVELAQPFCYALINLNPHPPSRKKRWALALMICKKGKIPHLLGQDDWSKPPTKAPTVYQLLQKNKAKTC